MAPIASPQPSVANPILKTTDESLDDEIAQVRAEIQTLTQRRTLLTSSLLASTKVQSRFSNLSLSSNNANLLNQDLTPLLQSSRKHSQSNIHRLGFGVTSFPFHDPSPELQSNNPLLGIRIDICDRTGRFDSPYYLFCMRDRDGEQSPNLRIHRHTIPALVPLQVYEKQYLPRQHDDEMEDSMVGDEGLAKKQDLHSLVERVRHDLVAWRLRQDAVGLVREELGIPEPKVPVDRPGSTSDEEMVTEDLEEEEEEGRRFGVLDFAAMNVDARQVRILWSDGRVARVRISDQGKIEKAVVIGLDNDRMRDLERILTDANPMVMELVDRLEKIEKTMSKRRSLRGAG
ncbi:uncharacterized protein Z518_04144 [Rhinocladiella mackenziei CBS 650.93]|uniref:Uncharacterized protein n=1 Tax=Rhinocladiella mackenziei CBS 650.93 TaxID=1442369 RepID=A0A0D2JAN0_9EURO|nr:uncharacterized protein Z518_04144 [Rhinocladiella mackenziei CBS 650.93]KIX06170.1 hypothetical protein Z518_04144 [Rhinocladiella mackenziei CBS 650.93]